MTGIVIGRKTAMVAVFGDVAHSALHSRKV